MAFLSPVPLSRPRRIRETRISVKRATKTYRLTPSHASANLSRTVQDLLLQQKEHPIFLPTLLEAPLSEALNALQTSTPPQFHRPTADSPRTKACALLADYHPIAIGGARRAILLRFPGIDTPGGKLYPSFRARACWRDLREFSRVVAYFIVAQRGFSDRGFVVMRDVYEEMEVPLDAMRVGVECLRDEFVGLCAEGEREMKEAVSEGFDTLLGLLDF